MKQHVVIVGAGITGLSVALGLQESAVDFTVLESSQRCGGRILSPDGYDMGPAWFWPGQQKILDLLNKFNIGFYPQQDEGFGLHQTTNGTHKLPGGYIPLAYRVENGLESITQAMSQQIGEHKIKLEHKVSRIEQDRSENTISVYCENRQELIKATSVVLALPPRLAEHSISFAPTLADNFVKEIRELPTWMAGNAKVLVRYDAPFWQKQQLSGTAFSQLGPLVQIHDASLSNNNEFALFGFVGDIASEIRNDETQLNVAVINQLTTLFGKEAQNFLSFSAVDWLNEPNLATALDAIPLREHPRYGISQTKHWNNQLVFAGTETVTYEGGLIEGALISAHKVLAEMELKDPTAN